MPSHLPTPTLHGGPRDAIVEVMRWPVFVFVLVLALKAGVAAADDELDIPGLDAADLRGDALVWEDASFYFEPWEGGLSAKFASFGRTRREEVGRAVPVRIVDSTMRSFVEIELPNRADCTWRRIEADSRLAGLRVFVKRADLAPVLVKPFAAQYSDGTRIKLAAGTPVMPTASGLYVIAARNDKLRLPIPHGSVGFLYKPGKVLDTEVPPGKIVRVDRSVTAKVGDESFVIRSSWLAPVPVKPTDVALVHWTSRCVDLVAEVPATAVRPAEPPRPTPIALRGSVHGTGPVIPAGAPLSTQAGREIAVASHDIGVPVPTAETVCFDAKIVLNRDDETYATQNRPIKLCAPASVVQR